MLQINLFLITLNVVGMKNIGGFAVSKMVLEDNAFVSSSKANICYYSRLYK